MERIYSIDGVEYTISKTAGGFWSVVVDAYGKENEYYVLNSKEEALEFILSASECMTED